MPGPMEGVKVVELGMWVAGPAAAGMLGDWGADVVKIEPPEGDPFRGLLSAMGAEGSSPPFELDNRNKRSVGVNLGVAEGRQIAAELVDGADVFVTNARPGALARAGLDYASVSARNPRLVYAHVTGYGLEGEDSDRAAYDVGAFWSRAGVAASLTPDGAPLPYQRGGMGDHMAGLAAAGAVSAALYSRERTGEGQMVSVSLLRIGMYMLGWDISMSLRLGFPTVPMTVAAPPNPLISAYEAGDGKRFWMLGLQADRHWPDVLRGGGASGVGRRPSVLVADGALRALSRARDGPQRGVRHASAGGVEPGVRPGGCVVGAGAARARHHRRSTGPRRGRLRHRAAGGG
jgi:crotonobetainyl-CoA:carnitine CoA-transferase CaiB-like acyl-CoA transferase